MSNFIKITMIAVLTMIAIAYPRVTTEVFMNMPYTETGEYSREHGTYTVTPVNHRVSEEIKAYNLADCVPGNILHRAVMINGTYITLQCNVGKTLGSPWDWNYVMKASRDYNK